MTRKIHKYKLECLGENNFAFKGNFKLLSAQLQNDDICLWIEEDIDSKIASSFKVKVVGTGYDVPEGYIYFNTVQIKEFVLHIYIEK